MDEVDPQLAAAMARKVELEEVVLLGPILQSVETQWPDLTPQAQAELARRRKALGPPPPGLEYGVPIQGVELFEIDRRRWYHKAWEGVVASFTVPIFWVLDIFGVRTRRRQRLVDKMTEGREALAKSLDKPLPEGLRGLGAQTGSWEISEHAVTLTAEEKEAAKGVQFPSFRNPLGQISLPPTVTTDAETEEPVAAEPQVVPLFEEAGVETEPPVKG